MTPAMLRQLLATTISHYKRRFYDNVTGSNAVLATLKDKGRISAVDGGADIRGPVIFDEELNAWYEGLDPLSRAQKETIGEAVWDPAMVAASITLSGEELAKNRGRAAIVKLMRGKMKNAENTLRTTVTKGIYSDGTVPKSFVGLAAIVSTDPSLGVVGGIDGATAPYWRNKVVAIDVTDGATTPANLPQDQRFSIIREGMNRLYRQCTVGTERPDVITLDNETYLDFESGLQDNQRYTRAGAAKLGFESYAFKNASVVAEDEGVGHPSDGGYFLNTEYLGLEHYADRGFDPLDLPESTPDMDGVTKHVAFMGAPTCYNRARQGRLMVTRV